MVNRPETYTSTNTIATTATRLTHAHRRAQKIYCGEIHIMRSCNRKRNKFRYTFKYMEFFSIKEK